MTVRPGRYKITMIDDQAIDAVRELRSRGLSPKEIARSLGMRPAAAADLVRALAAERNAEQPDAERVDCWVNAGWSGGLSIAGHPEWRDPGADGSADAVGLVSALVARRRRHRSGATVCVYLVDTYCLGVKNAIGPDQLKDEALSQLTNRVFGSYHAPPVPAAIELVQDLVFGAVEYARGLGFSAHPDFEQARAHLGPWSGPSAITFGCNGTPTYVAGPNDDPDRVLRTLRRAVGPNGFHCTVGLDLDGLRMAG